VEILKEVDKAIEIIYRFIYETLGAGGSQTMHQAIENVWNGLVG
jgi:hypothetical protein